jgi:hypothetical protein
MPKSTESSAKPLTIGVLDAQSLDQFIANAKEAWLEAHPQGRKRRGRPSEMGAIFEIIWGAELKGLLGKAPTQGKLFRLVHEQLGDQAPSEKAIRKYAKMWLLLFRKPWTERSGAERKWLAKQASVIWKLQHLFLDTLFKNAQRTDRSYSDRDEVELVIDGPHLKKLRQHLNALSRELARFDPPKEVDGYPYPEGSFLKDALRDYTPELFGRRRPR